MPEPKLEPKLSRLQEAYIKKTEREKLCRELLLLRMKRRNRLFMVGGLAVVFGIYSFTINSIKQETFLDELDVEIVKAKEIRQKSQ